MAQVVPKLVAHNIPNYWKNVVDQAFEKWSAINISISCVWILNFSLKHSASGLVETVEVELAKYLLLLRW